MPGKSQTQIGRLALREEGEFWNAYWAPYLDNMTGAVLIASIRMNLVDRNSAIKDSFMQLAKSGFGILIKDITGKTPSWSEPQPAPAAEFHPQMPTGTGKTRSN